jgi:hypothetical protein
MVPAAAKRPLRWSKALKNVLRGQNGGLFAPGIASGP